MDVFRPRDPVRDLRTDIDRLVTDSLFRSSLAGVKVVSLRTNEVLYAHDDSLLLRPASNTKLLTTAAALFLLGSDYRFRTTVAMDSLPAGGILEGNLYLKGYGDPDLATADLDSLADSLAHSGLTHVRGDLVVDATYFGPEYFPIGWMWDDEPDPDGAPVSALSLNKNCVRVTVAPDSLTHRTATLTVTPPTSYVSLVNCSTVVTDTVRKRISVDRQFEDRSNTIVVRGEILSDSPPVTQRTTVWQPELYAGTVFREALAQRGIVIDGDVRFGLEPDSVTVVAQTIQPMDSMLVNLNKISDNLSAENTLRVMGAVTFGPPGTTPSGLWARNQALATLGIDTTSFRFVDGSGVSHYDLVTPATLVDVLRAMYHQPSIFPLYYASLPIAGVDGTLSGRMRGTAAQGNLRGKTGTISGVASLSGYVTTADGELLAYSMLMQNFIRRTDLYRAVQDSIGARLAAFSRSGPTVVRR